MSRKARALNRRMAAGALVAAAVAAGTALLAWGALRSSLPQLDGTARVPSLDGPVTVERDRLGVPTLVGSSRTDVARALGFVHAQDRFFQMDLMRRRAAGELAALVGPRALPFDRAARMHRFRSLAEAVLARATPEERAVVEAYAQGVNAGLSCLRGRPFEYLLLRTRPEPWRAEDCVLVAYAAALRLQAGGESRERSLALVRDALGARTFAFLMPLCTADDGALDGSRGAPPALPTEEDMDLRPAASGAGNAAGAPDEARARPEGGAPAGPLDASDCFAVDGAHAGGGPAVLANALRLGLAGGYRACLRWGGRRVVGITLPGEPYVIAGSNGRVAWGFTAAHADTGDLVVLSLTASPNLYRVPNQDQAEPIEVRRETIQVRGAAPVTADYRWTRWGPITGEDGDHRPLAYAWTEDNPDATNLEIGRLEEAGGVSEAVAIAHRMGVPALNFIAADASGAIAWTVAGRLPLRAGFTGRLPTSWAFGDRRWDGFVPADRIPAILSPPGGRIWSAGNRTVGGAALDILGDGGYADPARARQIRGDLDALLAGAGAVTPRDLLAIEQDDRTAWLEPWRRILLDTLGPAAVAGRPARQELRDAGGRTVRLFREAVARQVFEPLFAPCAQADPGFDWLSMAGEQPLRTLLRERPAHLLNPAFESWDALLLAAADDTSAGLRRGSGGRTGTRTEGDADGTDALPRLLRRPAGGGGFFAVAPGREEAGVAEMADGQSDHPLSPYHRAGHDGPDLGAAPVPFLPGAAVHRLVLRPLGL